MTVDDMIHLNPIDDDDDDDNENVISLDKIKAELSQPSFFGDNDKLSHAGVNSMFRVVYI